MNQSLDMRLEQLPSSFLSRLVRKLPAKVRKSLECSAEDYAGDSLDDRIFLELNQKAGPGKLGIRINSICEGEENIDIVEFVGSEGVGIRFYVFEKMVQTEIVGGSKFFPRELVKYRRQDYLIEKLFLLDLAAYIRTYFKN